MLIVNFSSEATRKPLGWSVDFCPFCRDLCAVLLLEVEETIKVSILPIDTKTIGCLAMCGNCRALWHADPGVYGSLFPEPQPIKTHLAILPPEFLSRLTKRAKLEQRLRQGSLSRDERLELVAEPLLALEPFFQAKHSPSSIGPLTVMTIVFTFLGCLVPLFVSPVPQWEWGCGLAALGVVLLVLSLMRDGRVAIRRATEPVLLRAYVSLRPEQSELEEVLCRFGEEGRTSMCKVNPGRLCSLVARRPQTTVGSEHYRQYLLA